MSDGLKGKTFIIFGLSPRSLAISVGTQLQWQGAQVIYVAQSKDHYDFFVKHVGKSRGFSQEELDHVKKCLVLFCDVTSHKEIECVVEDINTGGYTLDGLVHSIAFADKTLLGDTLLGGSQAAIATAFDVSVASLAHILDYFQQADWGDVKSIVTFTFHSSQVVPKYAWMHPFKLALEGLVRGLAEELGPQGYRVNAISPGPIDTQSASAIPGFRLIPGPWAERSPLGWNMGDARSHVAAATIQLLDDPGMITGAVIPVDGGFHTTAFARPKNLIPD